MEGKLNSTAIMRKVSIKELWLWRLPASASLPDKAEKISNFLRAALSLTSGVRQNTPLIYLKASCQRQPSQPVTSVDLCEGTVPLTGCEA